MEGDLFLPLQALNDLRRRGLEALKEEILKESRRTEPEGNISAQKKKSKFGQSEKKICLLSENSGHFWKSPVSWGCSGRPGRQRCLFGCRRFPADSWKKNVEECVQKEKKCYLALPHIFRAEGESFFKANAAQLGKRDSRAFWFGSGRASVAEGYRFPVVCASKGTGRKRILLEQRNSKLLEKFRRRSSDFPWELNCHQAGPVSEAAREAGIPVELPIYGRIPMMVTAQCVRKTTMGCQKKNGQMELKDRTGARMPVKNRCAFCYNTIYNGSPLSLLGNERSVQKLKPTVLRLNFTTEGERETASIITAFRERFWRARRFGLPSGILPEDTLSAVLSRVQGETYG